MSVEDPPHVVALLGSRDEARSLPSAMEEAGFRVARCHLGEISRWCEWSGPVVAGMEALREVRPDVMARSLRSVPGPWIVVAVPGRAPLAAVTSAPGVDLRMVASLDRRALVTTVAWGWVAALERRAGAASRGIDGRHLCVAAAIRVLLRYRPGRRVAHAVEGDAGGLGGGREAVLAWLAKEVGISADHLSRLACVAGVDLRKVWDAWRVALAVALRLEQGSWEQAAWALGYEGASGLTALAERVVGASPRRLGREPGRWLDLAEEALMAEVARSPNESRLE